jgi:uncharacterized membrane protein YkvI
MIFIIAVHALMLAGSGATLQQSYGIPIYIGVAAMALMTAGTLLLGLNRIIDIIGIIGPVLILITVIISTLTIINNADHIVQNAERASKLDILRASPHWVASGFLYFGLTLPGLASFLPAIGNTVSGKAEISYASILGPCLYISAMILVILALTSSIDSVNGSMIPTMLLAQQFFPMFGAIFAVIIFLGIYTTTTPLVWTVCARFSEEGTTKYYSLVFLLTTVSAFGGVMLPFDKLVNLIYPTVGYAGLLFFCCAVITDTRIWLKRGKIP